MRHPRFGRLVVLLGAAFLAVAIATPASAATTSPIHLNPGQQGKTAAAFTNSCGQVPGGRQSGLDGWVFVLPGNQGTLVSLHVTFNDGTRDIVVDIPGRSYPNGFATNGTDKAYVVLPAGWTIVSGTGTAINPKGDKFNVTHVCRSGGGSESSPTPSKSSGGDSGGGGLAGSGGGAGNGSGGSLPITGTAVGGLVLLGLGLVAAGVTMLVLRRRRDAVEFQA